VEPWLSKLNAGDAQAAWNLFAERYRRLMLATIKRLVPGHDDVMDVFSTVCQMLSANDSARLKRYSDRSPQRASVSTWLVTVVRNLTVDRLRARRSASPHHSRDAPPLQQEILRRLYPRQFPR
jgi:DNA-directed RNA polymerase specialized sigma24 family protein